MTKAERKAVLLEAAIIKLKYRAGFQLQSASLFTEAAVLASQQFIEIRLRLLEEKLSFKAKPEDTFIGHLLTIALQVALFYGSAGISAISVRAIAHLLLSKTIADALNKYNVGSSLPDLFGNLPNLEEAVRNDPYRSIEEYTKFIKSSSTWQKIIDKGKATGFNASVGAYKSLTKVDIKLPNTDAHMTAITVAAQKYQAQSRQSIMIEESILESFVRLGVIEPEQIDMLYENLPGPSDAVEYFTSMRDWYRNAFEAVLWAKLLGYDRKNIPNAGAGTLPGVNDLIRDYLLDRLIDPRTGQTFGQLYANRKEEDLRNWRVVNLHTYLKTLGDRIRIAREKNKNVDILSFII